MRPLNAVTGAISNIGGLVPAGIAIAGIDYVTTMVLNNVNIGGGTLGNVVESGLNGIARALEMKAYMLAGG